MVCGERTSYWVVTHRRLIAFLKRTYLKQVVSLKRHALTFRFKVSKFKGRIRKISVSKVSTVTGLPLQGQNLHLNFLR